MSGIKQPVTQVRLTNVSVVRYKSLGIRFEVACYKNKILSFRAGLEHDIDEVLQSPHIFSNVSKGVLAKDEDLIKVFRSVDRDAIAKQILSKGEIQVSDKERAAQLAASFKDIAVLVAEMCINPSTGRPYPVRMIERGMKESHFSINPTKSTKSQALALIKSLKAVMPIERAAMRIAISINLSNNSSENVTAFREMIRGLAIKIEDEHETATQIRLTTLIEPNDFKKCEQSVAELQGSKCEIVDLKVQNGPVHAGDDTKSDGDEVESDHDSEIDSEAEMEQLSSQITRTKISRPTVQKTVAQPAAPKSKKARRRDDDDEDIRTVGDRPEYDIQDEIEDSTQVLQHQQQNRSKAKKERKNKQSTKDDDDEPAKPVSKPTKQPTMPIHSQSDSDYAACYNLMHRTVQLGRPWMLPISMHYLLVLLSRMI